MATQSLPTVSRVGEEQVALGGRSAPHEPASENRYKITTTTNAPITPRRFIITSRLALIIDIAEEEERDANTNGSTRLASGATVDPAAKRV
jgi:hypothetical protein